MLHVPGSWKEVSFQEFVSCPSNLAINRQTRMLADLELIGCYLPSGISMETQNIIMLQSAKDTLRHMEFFGVQEYQSATQYLFERTFKVKFNDDFYQKNNSYTSAVKLSKEQLKKAIVLNHLDVQLYDYGKQIFMQKVKNWIEKDIKMGQNYLIPVELQKQLKNGDLDI